MKKYEIKLQDTFSFAVEKRTALLSYKQYNSVVNAINNKIIVYSKSINNIHWNFVPISIKEVN